VPEIAPEISKRKIAQGPEVDKECSAIETELAELKAVYEQYFLGVERRPPTQKHENLKRRIYALKASFVQQTALKFRVGSVYQKFVTYERLWVRTLKEMEDGTYRRDVFKARLRQHKEEKAEEKKKAAAAAAAGKAAAPATDDFDVDEDTSPEALPPPPKPAAANGTRPSGSFAAARPVLDANALSDDKVRAIFNAYVSAKKRCNEDVSKLSFDAVAQNLRKQVPTLLKEHKAKAIEFKIVIKDGKAILKAVPKT
jgi:hypothetical protein